MSSPRRIGRYEILEEIGRGAMGVVYLAHDPTIDRQVAIKTIQTMTHLPSSDAAEMRERFEREARAAGKLQHPGIVTIYDVGEHDGRCYITMEYIDGSTLEPHTSKHDLLPVSMVMSLVVQACDALDYAHQQRIVHRDIKPGNMMLLRTGRLKITDFGLAKNPTSQLTQDGVLIGTPNYMSPEQITGRPLDGRSDLFSLGAVMYELLTGERPFAGDTVTTIMYRILHEVPAMPHMVNPRIPPAVGRVMARALEKDPTQRFQNGQEMARALQGRTVAQAVAQATAVGSYGAAAVPVPVAHSSRSSVSTGHAGAGVIDSGEWDTNRMPAIRPGVEDPGAMSGSAARQAGTSSVRVRPTAMSSARKAVRNIAIGLGALAIILMLPRTTPLEDKWGSTPSKPLPWRSAGVNAPQVPPVTLPGGKTPATEAAPAAAATAETVAIPIRTSPPGGRIYLDDVELTDGVARLPRGDNSPHTVVAENDCFIEKVTWRRSQGSSLVVELKTAKISQVPVSSNPPGAAIKLNGKPTGLKTPADVPVAVCGEHVVALSLEGFKDVQMPTPADLSAMQLSLPRIPMGFVSLEAPYPVEILEKGKRLGTAGEKIKLTAGKHVLTMRNEELFVERSLTVDIAADKSISPASGLPATGSVTILASPSNCVITINGRDLGPPPIIDLLLASGTYKVKAVYVPSGEVKESSVTVPAGGSTRVPFKFTP